LILKIFLILLHSSFVISADQHISRSKIYLNRFQLSNVLMKHFGPESNKFIKKYIMKRPSIFYGACDIYGQVYQNINGQAVNYYPLSQCYSGLNGNKISMNAKLNKIRQALMLKTCISLVEDKSTYNYFLKEYQIKTLKKDQVTKSIIKIFYKDRDYSMKSSNIKDLIVEVCISKGWQRI
jgi:hypothetical protein